MRGQQFVSDFNLFRVKTNNARLKNGQQIVVLIKVNQALSTWQMAEFQKPSSPKNQFSLLDDGIRQDLSLLRKAECWLLSVRRGWAQSGVTSRVSW